MGTQPKLVSATEFKIEKGVPVPPSSHLNTKYPFAQMEVGDSIHATNFHAPNAAHQWGKTNGRKFASRKEGDGYRIWRIA